MAERRLLGLKRVVGVNALSSTAYGNVGSSIYYALGLVAALALGLTPLVFLLAGALFFCTATTYAEATAMYPEAGGASLFVRRALNEFWSFFTAWAQMLSYIIIVAISAFFAAGYFGAITFDFFATGIGEILFAAALVALLAAINVRGVSKAVNVNIVLATIDFLSQVAIVALGVFLVLNPESLVDGISLLGTAPTWSDLLLAIPVGTVAYTGIETVANMASEARDEKTTIPAAIKRVMIAVFLIYFTLPFIALSALPVTCEGGECSTLLAVPAEEGGFANNPVLGIVSNMELGVLQTPGELYVGILAVVILVAATNAGVLGVSRLTYSMGLYRQLPDALRRLHPRYGTPYLGIMVFSGVAILAILPGQADFLGASYAFGAMLSFSMAHLAVIRLRAIAPDQERPYRSPGRLQVRGRDLPPLAVLGLMGTGLAFLVVTVLDTTVAIAGAVWLVLGMMVYIVYRRRHGLDLTTTHKVTEARPVTEREAEYESVLVAFETRDYNPQAVNTAIRLAARRRRGIHVLALVTVPASSPLDAALPEAELAAWSLIEQARVQGGRRVTGRVEKVRPGQAGRLIVQEARTLRARALILPLPQRGGGSIFPKTIATVLSDRPCRVILEADPRPDDRRGVVTTAG